MKHFRAILTSVALAGTTLTASAEVVNAIRAVVHDSVVTQEEVEFATAPAEESLRRQYRGQPETYQRELIRALNENLEERLRRQLVLHDFETGGYKIPEPILDSAVQEDIDKRGGRERLVKTLQARGITYEKFRQQIRENIILSALRSKNISQEIIVSPHKIETYYLANKDKYKVDEEVKLRRIMLNKEANPETAKKLAEEIRTKVKEGAAFSEMASIYSQAPDRRDGGLWGWVERKVLRDELASVAFTLKPGEVSEPIDVGNSYFLLLVEDRRTTHNKALSEVRDEIEATLLQEERTRLEKQWIERLKKKTFIRYF